MLLFLTPIFIYSIIIISFYAKNISTKNFVGNTNKTVSFSLLIPIKNEELHLKQLITNLKLLNLKAIDLEIILINDNSTDNSYEIILQETSDNKLFKLINLESNYGKKNALLEGLKLAKNELIIHTDADVVLNTEWLKTISSFYIHHNFKLAFSPILYANENTFFEKMQSLEILNIAGITGGSALIKCPILITAANLVYHNSLKNLFINSINTATSGDDMFFLEKVKKLHKNDIKFIKSPNSVVYTFAETDFKSFFNQRLRWIGKSKRFTDFDILFVGIVTTVVNLLVVLWFIYSLFEQKFNALFLIFITIKFFIELTHSISLSIQYKKQKLLWYFPILFVLHPIYLVVFSFLSLVITPKWKNGTVKN